MFTPLSLSPLLLVSRLAAVPQITRKDKLSENIFRMKQLFGARHFDFIPETFVLPQEMSDFATTYSKGALSSHTHTERVCDFVFVLLCDYNYVCLFIFV